MVSLGGVVHFRAASYGLLLPGLAAVGEPGRRASRELSRAIRIDFRSSSRTWPTALPARVSGTLRVGL